MEEKSLRCFQHCKRDHNILCFSVPLTCPICGDDVTKTPMRIPPFLITSPFTSSDNNPCCVLIRPTVGDFLHNFTNQSDLHVGVSDSTGTVFEYDENGITMGSNSWTQCLKVDLIDKDTDDEMVEKWDEELIQMFKDGTWSATVYDEERFNCYDFVLSFLLRCGLDSSYLCVSDRNMFCKEMIVPQTHKAGQYISTYREVVTKGCVIQPLSK